MNNTIKKGLFPLSGDPITIGHIEMIKMAKKKCDTLLVVIANNDAKSDTYTFSHIERIKIAQRAIKENGLTKTYVLSTDGPITDVYMKEGCDALFRGIRNEQDERAEKKLIAIYEEIYPPLAGKCVLLQSPPQYTHISSSVVKDFTRHNINTHRYVPLFVKDLLERRINGQVKIGVTGEIAVGKTTVTKEIVARLRARGEEAHHLQLDELLHAVYAEQSDGALRVRNALIKRFGADICTPDRKNIDRAALAQKLFAPDAEPDALTWAQKLVYPHVERLYREALLYLRGYIFIEWAQFVEMNMLSWVNGNVLLVSTSKQDAYAHTRGLSKESVDRIADAQYNTATKKAAIEEFIQKKRYGHLISYHNDHTMDDEFLNAIVQIKQKALF